MKICLVRLPFYSLLGIEKSQYPLNIGYLASALQANGHEVNLVDGDAIDFGLYGGLFSKGALNRLRFFLIYSEGRRRLPIVDKIMTNEDHLVWQSMVDRIKVESPDVVGITCSTHDVTSLDIITKKIKKEIGNIPIIAGGVHPSALPLQVMERIKNIDFAVVGEGEDTLVELTNFLENGKPDLKDIKGIGWREEGIIINPPRPLIADLDSIPFPNRDLGERKRYHPFDLVLTSRGCPFRCIFCAANTIWKKRVRYRSVDNVIEEIELLRHRYQTKTIRITDDTFTIDKKRVLEFCQKMSSQKLTDITFSLGSRVDTIDEEMVKALANIGVDDISLGIESGSPRIQKLIKKDIDPEDVLRLIEMTNKHKVESSSFYMIGHPTETIDDIEMSKKLFLKSKTTNAYLHIVCPYPDTELARIAEERGIDLTAKYGYRFFPQAYPLVNLTNLSDAELEKHYRRFARLMDFVSLKSKLVLALKVLFKLKAR